MIMTKVKRFLMTAAVAGTTALAPLSADAFFGMMSYMMGGGWGSGWGWGPGWGWGGYPYYGYGWGGYPYYGGWGGYPHYGGWGYPYAYGAYPHYAYPVVAAPAVVTQPTEVAAK